MCCIQVRFFSSCICSVETASVFFNLLVKSSFKFEFVVIISPDNDMVRQGVFYIWLFQFMVVVVSGISCCWWRASRSAGLAVVVGMRYAAGSRGGGGVLVFHIVSAVCAQQGVLGCLQEWRHIYVTIVGRVSGGYLYVKICIV